MLGVGLAGQHPARVPSRPRPKPFSRQVGLAVMSPAAIARTMMLATGVVMGLTAAAERPQVSAVYPLGLPRGVETQLEFSADDQRADAARLWSPHIELTATAVDDSKGLRWSCQIAEDQPLGDFDLYLITDDGISNRLRLELSSMPEVHEQQLADAEEEGGERSPWVELPVVVNGKLDPATDRDAYRFVLRRGQRCHVMLRAASLGSEVAAALRVIDPQGREILHDDGSSPEPRLAWVAEHDGEYSLLVHERAYRQATSNAYRIWITNQPLVVAAFPAVLRSGQQQVVTLYGHGFDQTAPSDQSELSDPMSPLETLEVTLTAPQAATGSPLDRLEYRHPGTVGAVHFGLAGDALVVEQQTDSDSPQTAQQLTPPADVSGRFHRLGDRDWYALEASEGETFWFAAMGQRLGQVMDLELTIHDEHGKALATLSDTGAVSDRDDPLAAATLDPSGTWTAPADGLYHLVVRDLYASSFAGPDRRYRLLLSREPTAMILVSQPVWLQAGEQAELTIARQGPLADSALLRVHAAQLPAEISADVVTLDSETAAGKMTFSATKDARPWTGTLSLVAELVPRPADGQAGGKASSEPAENVAQPVAVRYVAGGAIAPLVDHRTKPILVVAPAPEAPP